MAADRGAIMDQSLSPNIRMADESFGKLTSMAFYGWKKGLGRVTFAHEQRVDAIKFTVDQLAIAKNKETEKEAKEAMMICSIDNREACVCFSG